MPSAAGQGFAKRYRVGLCQALQGRALPCAGAGLRPCYALRRMSGGGLQRACLCCARGWSGRVGGHERRVELKVATGCRAHQCRVPPPKHAIRGLHAPALAMANWPTSRQPVAKQSVPRRRLPTGHEGCRRTQSGLPPQVLYNRSRGAMGARPSSAASPVSRGPTDLLYKKA